MNTDNNNNNAANNSDSSNSGSINSDSLGNTIKDPSEWITGTEPMTGAQKSYLNTLASEAKEEIPEDLTKAGASMKIEELQDKTGRGKQ
ncbi:MAG: DUF3072 domain-containing protein [Chitinophagaceae bacterium]|nr:DUF3072 domain-containing protein [Chitinophagaceae bacterium]